MEVTQADYHMSNPVPVPSSLTQRTAHVAIVLSDDRSIPPLLTQIVDRSGLSQSEIARRLGVTRQTVNQVLLARKRPTLQWFAKLAEVCGARLTIEFPGSPLGS